VIAKKVLGGLRSGEEQARVGRCRWTASTVQGTVAGITAPRQASRRYARHKNAKCRRGHEHPYGTSEKTAGKQQWLFALCLTGRDGLLDLLLHVVQIFPGFVEGVTVVLQVPSG
jgi:hypothetical protein